VSVTSSANQLDEHQETHRAFRAITFLSTMLSPDNHCCYVLDILLGWILAARAVRLAGFPEGRINLGVHG
jgi:hypothetical protein